MFSRLPKRPFGVKPASENKSPFRQSARTANPPDFLNCTKDNAIKKKKTPLGAGSFGHKKRIGMRPTTIYSLSTELGANTIDPDKLNCRVRNGYGCCLIGNIISLIPTP